MPETWTVIIGLALATFAIRLLGFLLGARLPATGPWAAGFEALPGALILSLLTVILLQSTWIEWTAAAAALLVALATRNLPLTMITGIGMVWVLRQGFL